MYKDENILIFNYPFDRSKLLAQYHKLEMDNQFIGYSDHRCEISDWKIARTNFDYADELCETFGITARPRFYQQKPHVVIGEHIDTGTLCSINILLEDDAPAPVSFGSKNYTYSQCLLNTQNMHSVVNGDKLRILFKLSIFDMTFEEVAERIMPRLEPFNVTGK